MGQLRYRLINSSNPRIFATKNLGRKFLATHCIVKIV